MPKVQLSDIAAAAERKFGDFEVVVDDGTTLIFHNPMRMSKEKRTGLVDVFNIEKRVETNPDDDTFDLYRAAFAITAKSPADYEKLVAAVGDVPATWEALFKEFEGRTEAEKA